MHEEKEGIFYLVGLCRWRAANRVGGLRFTCLRSPFVDDEGLGPRPSLVR